MIEKPTWDICSNINFENLPKENFEYFGNFYTKGLNRYGHKELCICLNIPYEIARSILNRCGMMIVNEGMIFKRDAYEGIIDDGYDIFIEEYPNDSFLYIFLPDIDNNFPQNDDCNEFFKLQKNYADYIYKNKINKLI